MKITVTQEHIDKARREAVATHRAPRYICPVAQVLRAEGNQDVYVAKHYASFTDPVGRHVIASLPGIATDWIEAFDAGEPVQPFEFEMGYAA